MGLTLQELLDWVPEISELAKHTRVAAVNHGSAADFLKDLAKASNWEGRGGDAARSAMLMTAFHHDPSQQNLTLAALGMRRAELDAEALRAKVKTDILGYAGEKPAVAVDTTTNSVIAPDTTGLDEKAAKEIDDKVSVLKQRIADALTEGERIDRLLTASIAYAAGMQQPGQAENQGPIAGTGAIPASATSARPTSVRSARCPAGGTWRSSGILSPATRWALVRITRPWRCRCTSRTAR